MTNVTETVAADSRCPYCSGVFAGRSTESPSWDAVLREADGTVVVPTRGMIVEGWLLAIPREHILASRALAPSRAQDLWKAVKWAAAMLTREYGTFTIFEHGAATPSSLVGCGVDHVHIHVAPLPYDLAEAARNHELGRRLTWEQIDNWAAIRDHASVAKPYLAVQASGGDVWIGVGEIPSQFFRRVIAYMMGEPERFDWRGDPGLDQVKHTVARLSAVGVDLVGVVA
jgi:ATP adenylyltransferase